MESLQSPEEIVRFEVPAEACRSFMRKIAPRDMWPLLQAQKDWGGHFHRAVLGCALSDALDYEMIDIVPGYIEALLADPKGRLHGDSDKQRLYAKRLVSANIEHIDYDETNDPLVAFERSLRYASQADIPEELWDALLALRDTEQ